MTPERAAAIAERIDYECFVGPRAVRDIQLAILAACKEQKECDARICETFPNQLFGDSDSPYNDCAAAIRSAE